MQRTSWGPFTMRFAIGRTEGLRRILPGLLAAAAVLFAVSLSSAPAEASWSGWGGSAACTPTGTGFTGDCPTVKDACESWAAYRGTWVRDIKPAYSSAGEITQHTCLIRHFLAAGPDFQDPTHPSCHHIHRN